MASSLKAMASNLLAMASSLKAMASNLLAMASSLKDGVQPTSDGLQPKGDGVQPTSDGLQPKGDGVQPTSDGLQPKGDGVQPTSDGLQPKGDGVQPTSDGLQPESDSIRQASEAHMQVVCDPINASKRMDDERQYPTEITLEVAGQKTLVLCLACAPVLATQSIPTAWFLYCCWILFSPSDLLKSGSQNTTANWKTRPPKHECGHHPTLLGQRKLEKHLDKPSTSLICHSF